jgi:hypothetical protein
MSSIKTEAEQVNLLTGIKPDSFWISGHVRVYTCYNIGNELWCSSVHGSLASGWFLFSVDKN